MTAASLESRTFHPYCASSPTQRFVLRGILPALAVFVTIFVVWFLLNLLDLIPNDASIEQREAGWPLVVLPGLLVGSMPIPFHLLWYFLDRELLRHAIDVDVSGMTQRRGKRKPRCTGEDIERVTAFRLGRMQFATLHCRQGKLRIDAGVVDNEGPQPRRAMDLRGGYLVLPDGKKQSLKIEDDELYKLVHV